MSIGAALAESRHQAGLTVSQVSERTRIREAIIRDIERDDYSTSGGAFYTRGHIRSIARAVGADPERLIRDYNADQGPTRPITAAQVFESSAPIRIRDRRGPNWTVVLALVLAAAVGFGIYTLVHRSGQAVPHRSAASGRHPPPAPPTTPPPPARARHRHHRVVIELAATGDCWVQLTTRSGQTIFSGTLYPGSSTRWIEHRAVLLQLGNPGAVKLTVNGRHPAQADTTQTVTLALGPGRRGAHVRLAFAGGGAGPVG